MVLERTGWSARHLRSLTARHELVAAGRNSQGWTLYRESDVTALMKNREALVGDRARPAKLFPATVTTTTPVSTEEVQIVFRLLEERKSLVQIVLETGYHSTVVYTILRDYELLSHSILVRKPIVDQIHELELEDAVFPIQKAEEILDLLRKTAAKCVSCQTRPRSRFCGNCGRDAALAKYAPRALEELAAEAGRRKVAAAESTQDTEQGSG
jgi:hypothetical protein